MRSTPFQRCGTAVACDRAGSPRACRAIATHVAALVVLGAPTAAIARPPALPGTAPASAAASSPAATRHAELLLAPRFGRGKGVPQSYAKAGAWITGKETIRQAARGLGLLDRLCVHDRRRAARRRSLSAAHGRSAGRDQLRGRDRRATADAGRRAHDRRRAGPWAGSTSRSNRLLAPVSPRRCRGSRPPISASSCRRGAPFRCRSATARRPTSRCSKASSCCVDETPRARGSARDAQAGRAPPGAMLRDGPTPRRSKARASCSTARSPCGRPISCTPIASPLSLPKPTGIAMHGNPASVA